MYDGMPYPGYVSDIDNDDVFVRCMHRFPGKKIDSCMFYWPKCVLDECWCNLDNVACLIKIQQELDLSMLSKVKNGPKLCKCMLSNDFV